MKAAHEHDDHDVSGTMSVSLATSLGSLSSSAQPETSPFQVQRAETLSFVKEKLGSPLVAVRRDSLATLLKAFDEILLNSAA